VLKFNSQIFLTRTEVNLVTRTNANSGYHQALLTDLLYFQKLLKSSIKPQTITHPI